MANIDTHASGQEQPTPADHALARRIAERVRRLGAPQPWTNGFLDGEVRAVADRLLAEIQDLDDAAQALEERACRANTLVAALDAEQAGWAATEDGVVAVSAAVAELRALGVTVVVTSGDSRPRKAGMTLGLAW